MGQSQTVCCSRRLGLCLVLLVSLAVNGSIHGQAKAEPPGFLLPPELERWPNFAAMAVGSSVQPATRALSALAVFHAAEHLPSTDIRPPFESKKTRSQVGAGMLFLSGFTSAVQPGPQFVCQPALSTLIELQAGYDLRLDFWTLINTDKIRTLSQVRLDEVPDDKPIPDLETGDNELVVYFDMVTYAGQTATRVFYDQANRELSYRNLMNEPKKSRGQVAYLEGRLWRLDRRKAPLHLEAAGFKYIYEGWFFVNNNGNAPAVAIFTELPEGLKIGDKQGVQIGFAGYFYKKLRYSAGVNGKQIFHAPVLIGRTPRVLTPHAGPVGNDPNQELPPLFLGLIAATFLGIVGLTVYFRYNDMKVRQRLARAKQQEFVLPPPEEDQKNPPGEVTNPPDEPTDYQNGSSSSQTRLPSSLSFPDRPDLN